MAARPGREGHAGMVNQAPDLSPARPDPFLHAWSELSRHPATAAAARPAELPARHDMGSDYAAMHPELRDDSTMSRRLPMGPGEYELPASERADHTDLPARFRMGPDLAKLHPVGNSKLPAR